MNPGRARLAAGIAAAGLLLEALPVALAAAGGHLPHLQPAGLLLAGALGGLGGAVIWWPAAAERRRAALALLLLAQLGALGAAAFLLLPREPAAARALHDRAAGAARARTLPPTHAGRPAAW
ncbi:MAG: hypothetical protein ACYDIE_13805, partial [Candidatus Krumholzibacteriia bacterium]